MARIKTFKLDTLSLHAGQRPDPTTGARATPIYQMLDLDNLHLRIEVGQELEAKHPAERLLDGDTIRPPASQSVQRGERPEHAFRAGADGDEVSDFLHHDGRGTNRSLWIELSKARRGLRSPAGEARARRRDGSPEVSASYRQLAQ